MSCFDRFVFLVTGRIAFDGPPSRLASFFYGLGYEAPSYENPADFYIKCLQEVPEAVLEAWRTVAAKRDKEDLEAAIAGTSGFSVLPSSSSSSTSLPPLPRPSSRGGMGKVFGSNHSMSRGGGGTGELPSMVDGSTAGGHPSLVLPGGEVLVLDREATWLDKEAAADVLQQNSFLHQFSVLLRRMMTHNCKDRRKVLVGLGMEIFTGLVVGVVWFQQEVYTQKSVFPVLGVFCMLTTISIFDSFLNLILTFPLTRALHFREYNNGTSFYPPTHLPTYICQCSCLFTHSPLPFPTHSSNRLLPPPSLFPGLHGLRLHHERPLPTHRRGHRLLHGWPALYHQTLLPLHGRVRDWELHWRQPGLLGRLLYLRHPQDAAGKKKTTKLSPFLPSSLLPHHPPFHSPTPISTFSSTHPPTYPNKIDRSPHPPPPPHLLGLHDSSSPDAHLPDLDLLWLLLPVHLFEVGGWVGGWVGGLSPSSPFA